MSKARRPKATGPADYRIAKRIRLRRLTVGLSQGAVAAALGLTFQQVQKYELGANRVSASRLQEIANVLRAPVSFFYDEGPNAPMPSMLLDTPQSISILRAFKTIENPKLRRQAVALVEAIAAVKG
ncbi:helix-turn-helix domain-containing protein [Microvirga sp. 2MCAF38]|uniref:helix-turn-helix domain-containing protein n=1 Tax=Microvirga sp. 2MCAF38 TaxID=3232989 RepID=UPI003F9466DC